MGLFLVASAPETSEALGEAIRSHYADAHFEIEPGQWLISDFGKSAEQVWAGLGFGTPETDGHIRAIIVGVGTYWGRHKRDLWPWMKEQLERQNG